MAAKKKRAKAGKARRTARRGARKVRRTGRKVARKVRKTARKKRNAPRKKALKEALAPSMERLRTGATEMSQGMMEGGRVLIGEAEKAGTEAKEKVKDTVTDWWNRPS